MSQIQNGGEASDSDEDFGNNQDEQASASGAAHGNHKHFKDIDPSTHYTFSSLMVQAHLFPKKQKMPQAKEPPKKDAKEEKENNQERGDQSPESKITTMKDQLTQLNLDSDTFHTYAIRNMIKEDNSRFGKFIKENPFAQDLYILFVRLKGKIGIFEWTLN